jgi:CHAT domain-containing protein
MSLKKICILLILWGGCEATQAQSWQNCYDSTLYYSEQQDHTLALAWADKFMIFSNYFITKKEFYPNYHVVVSLIFDIYASQNQKQKGIDQLLTWKKKLDDIPTEKAKNVIENNRQLLHSSLLFYLGEFNYRLGNYREAQKQYEISLQAREKYLGSNHPNTKENLEQLGKLMVEMGNMAEAEEMLMENNDISERIYGRLHPKRANAFNEIGDVFSAKSDTTTAIYFYNQAKEIYAELNEGLQSLGYAHNLVSQGELYYKMGFYTAVEALYRQAQYIYEKHNFTQKVEYADLLNRFSLLYLRLNNLVDANRLVLQAKEIHQREYSAKHPAFAKDLHVLASIYLSAGYYPQAEKLLQEAVTIYKESGVTKQIDYLMTISQLAECYEQTKEVKKADELFVAVIDSFRTHISEQSIELAGIEANLANLYYHLGKYEEALELHERSLETRYALLDDAHPEFLESINDLSLLSWAYKEIPAAEKYFEQSIENYTKQFNRYFSFLSEREKEFYYNRIRTFFEKYNSFALQRSVQKPAILGQIYNNQLRNKGLLFYTSQNVREQVLASKDDDLFQKYRGWIQLKEQLSKVYKLDPQDITAQNIPLDSLEEVANFIEKDLSLRIAITNTKSGKEQTQITWKDIQKKLNPDEAAIEMIRFQEFLPDSGGHYSNKIYYAALVVTAKTTKYPALVLLENGEELEKKYVKFYRNSIKFKLKDIKSYGYFWQKIDTANVLVGVKKIYFSPDGIYNQLNINTLFDSKHQKFVVDKTEIHTLTNTRDLIALKGKKVATASTSIGKAFLLGFPNYHLKKQKFALNLPVKQEENPALLPLVKNQNIRTRGGRGGFRGGQIEELPGTKVEIENIAKILSQYHVENQVALGDSALEGNIKKINDFTVLHIGTHGFFSPTDFDDEKTNADSIRLESNLNNPLLNSGLLLAGADNAFSQETLLAEINALQKGSVYEDGVLTAYEAMNLNLGNTDLVILSACETGLGEIRNGEGVYGLQRAFQTAGAKTIVMSLWKVSDEATQQLMEYFYLDYCKTKNKRHAFISAQLKLRETFSDPYYWGAFVMIGE